MHFPQKVSQIRIKNFDETINKSASFKYWSKQF